MITIFLAILGLSFLVFIHEFGHYYMARKVGMKVEAFAIGFGKPIFKWKKDGVEWRINIIPFGGYVKIAGMQQEKGQDPYQIKEGYFGKKPWDRIKVAFMGPMANFIFAFLAFTFIWISGGQEKSLSEFNNRIGYVDQGSNLYKMGVRPGDEVIQYDNRPFKEFRDVMFSAISSSETIPISVNKLDHFTKAKQQRYYNLYAYHYSDSPIKTIGFLAPASYLIYDSYADDSSPMVHSGIKQGDRIVWVDGELIYSISQLHEIINQPYSFITFVRDGQIHHTRVPNYPIKEFRLSSQENAELDDWAHESDLGKEIKEVLFIPYVITTNAVVQYPLAFIDPLLDEQAKEIDTRNPYQIPLLENDRIIAVNGKKVSTSYDLIKNLQQKMSLIVVENQNSEKTVFWKDANTFYNQNINYLDLEQIISYIGTENILQEKGNLRLLNPITPQPISQMHKATLSQESLERIKNELFLGINIKDQKVIYNPNPFELYAYSLNNIWKTLTGLFSGTLHPKYVSGPVGIVQAVSMSWMYGVKEALFWLGFISLNLGIVNLLPIPMLDGGHIVFSTAEIVTRKRLNPKTMEKIVYPFMLLLIAFFIYVTYQDILRVWFK